MKIVAVLWGFTVALFTYLSLEMESLQERERERENLLVEGSLQIERKKLFLSVEGAPQV